MRHHLSPNELIGMSQYEFVLAAANFVRHNPDSHITKKLKGCKTQDEMVLVYKTEIVDKVTT